MFPIGLELPTCGFPLTYHNKNNNNNKVKVNNVQKGGRRWGKRRCFTSVVERRQATSRLAVTTPQATDEEQKAEP